MISEKQIEQLTELLVNRIEKANLVFLEEIGKSIKQIGNLTPSKAQQLVQVLKYGTSYNDIVYKISQLTNLNIRDINKIFEEFAKKDQLFFKKFYEYRNVPFIPYENNYALQSQVNALKNIAVRDMDRFTRQNVLGYSIRELPTKAFPKGKQVFLGLRETYNRVLDEALLSVSQGKESFDTSIRRILKEIGGSGLKTLDYQSGRSIRLDSAVRMHLQDSLRNLHNETQKIYGQEFGANMVEVSHHSNSAPDHIDSVDGKQFARIDVIKEQIASGIEKEIKLSDIVGNRVKVKGKWYDDFDYINDNLDRPVGQLNCYHYTFEGILGISQPQYTEKQLKEDKEKNEKGCVIDGKHYTLYETTQLFRNIERKIREQKDIQILAKTSNNIDLINLSQQNITMLTNKYKQISKISGLPMKNERLRVIEYKRINTKNMK